MQLVRWTLVARKESVGMKSASRAAVVVRRFPGTMQYNGHVVLQRRISVDVTIGRNGQLPPQTATDFGP